MGRLRWIALAPRLLAVMVAAYVSQSSASDNYDNGSRSRSG